MIAFSVQHQGKVTNSTEMINCRDHLREIGFQSFHTILPHFNTIHPILYDHDTARDQILRLLGAPESKDKDEDKGELSETDLHTIAMSSTEKTAYKHMLANSSSTCIPNGDDILNIVRQPLGTPYNWVLFGPSNNTLTVVDAGSGGVIEMTAVLQQCYNDRVLYGLSRISFMGAQFGRRQFWCGLEWKGEDCSSVKMMRQFRECHDPMSKMIGDRSLTLSNISASEMTPELVVERVKRSCNVTDFDLTVGAMQNAHDEEQKAIKTYWDKLLKDEEIKREQEKIAKLEYRREKLASRMELRDKRRRKWSRMSATELLEDFGRDDTSGWVLFEIAV